MSRPTRREQRAQTRARLLAVGSQLFSKQGVAATKATDIASSAGVSVGTLYLHFGDKMGLLEAVLLETIDSMALRLDEVFARKLRGDDVSTQALAEQFVTLVESQPDRVRLCLSPEVLATPVGERFVETIMDAQEERIRQAQAARVMRPDLEPSSTARALMGAFIGVLGWWAQTPAAVDRAHIVRVLESMLGALTR